MATEASATQLNLYLSQCISVHNAKDRHVRLRICEICAGILSGLPLDAEIEYVPHNAGSNATGLPCPSSSAPNGTLATLLCYLATQ